jgi:prolyl-tRNA synthetase
VKFNDADLIGVPFRVTVSLDLEGITSNSSAEQIKSSDNALAGILEYLKELIEKELD